ncbi:hypothetical protein KR222_001062 [Zaprionus bogoriensis]|nr:hypothetical protein KR222_001062 [Zaprionus bogoriensis]
MSRQLEADCAQYAHVITKRMWGYFDEMKQKIDSNDAEMQSRDKLIETYKQEVADLRLKIAYNNGIIDSSKDKDKEIKYLRARVEQLRVKEAESIKQLEKDVTKFQVEKTFLKAKQNSDAERIKQLEKDVTKVQEENTSLKSKQSPDPVCTLWKAALQNFRYNC